MSKIVILDKKWNSMQSQILFHMFDPPITWVSTCLFWYLISSSMRFKRALKRGGWIGLIKIFGKIKDRFEKAMKNKQQRLRLRLKKTRHKHKAQII